MAYIHILLKKANKQRKCHYTCSKETRKIPLHALNPIPFNQQFREMGLRMCSYISRVPLEDV